MASRFLLSSRTLLVFLVITALAPLTAAGGQAGPASQAPPRDQAQAQIAEPTGTGRILVAVVAADTGAPVKRVRVSLGGMVPPARPAAGAPGATAPPSVSIAVDGAVSSFGAPAPGRIQKEGETDENGRVDFSALPAANYNIMVLTPASFVRPTTAESFQLADGQSLSRTIRLDRGGAITGRVVDETGDPIARASVTALRKDGRGSARLSSSGMPGSTDDRGQFRLYGLAPGDYYVSATYFNPSSMGGASAEPRTGYVPTYYPGAPTLEGARVVTVKAGQDSGGVDWGMLLGRLGRISGTLADSAGAPVVGRGAYLSLSSRSPEQPGLGRGASIKPDGTFTIPDVPPGDYYVSANVFHPDAPQAEREGAFVPVTVNGDEVTLNIRTNTGATLSGRVVTEGRLTAPPPVPGMPTSAPPAAALRSMVSVRPAMSGNMLPAFASGKSEPVSEDGTFRLTGVRGSVLLTASSGLRALKEIRRAGQDLTTTALELSGTESIEDIEVVFTYDTGNVMGTVTDGRGQPVAGAWVIAFPDDPKRWIPGSAFVRPTRTMGTIPPSPPPATASAARPDGSSGPAPAAPGAPTRAARQPGQFVVTRLLPGRYLLLGMESGDSSSLSLTQFDADSLSALRPKATAVTIAVGETAVVDLKVTKIGS